MYTPHTSTESKEKLSQESLRVKKNGIEVEISIEANKTLSYKVLGSGSLDKGEVLNAIQQIREFLFSNSELSGFPLYTKDVETGKYSKSSNTYSIKKSSPNEVLKAIQSILELADYSSVEKAIE